MADSRRQVEKGILSDASEEGNIVLNPSFEDGLNNWSGRGCRIVLHDALDGKIFPKSGEYFAAATGRTQTWNGIQQELTTRVKKKLAYQVTALVRIYGKNVASSNVGVTLYVQTPDLREQYINIASVQATNVDWSELTGKFLINNSPSKIILYFEGPPVGVDILVNYLTVKHAEKTPPSPPPSFENSAYGVNIIENSDLHSGTDGWFPLGNCNLSVQIGAPRMLPPMARDTVGHYEPVSGRYLLVTNRSATWMGPAQMITEKLQLFLTYQVSAWVRVGANVPGPQTVSVSLSVDDQWVNGGQVEVQDGRWHELGGSFRLEKEPSKVMVFLQGPNPGVNLMVGSLHIFPVDRCQRFKHLQIQTDQIRKRDVIVKLAGMEEEEESWIGAVVRVKQIENSFPVGSCINRTNLDNEDFVDFFVKHFNWSVFGNELKWFWTEPQPGVFNYRDADEMLDFCQTHNKAIRGHCIFWEVESNVQQWVRNLNRTDLQLAVNNRITGLLTRYKGKFRHYDVNNEMLHGSFYQDRLGKPIRPYMFKISNQVDPSPALFVNDYHIEDGNDTKSSPEKYADQIVDLQGQGAPVGGIGIQAHIDSPIGSIVCSALDKLGTLGIPIWLTELDVSSVNEYVRADDLEVMLREAYAHPSVEGVMLWGFWELFMSRENAYLVDAEGRVNEAGKRFLKLKEEWLSHSHGFVNEDGEFLFRGFHGTYEVEVVTACKKVTTKVVVEKGASPIVISIDICS